MNAPDNLELIEHGPVKQVHVCPECETASGWGGPREDGEHGFYCLKCGHPITAKEWKALRTVDRYGWAEYREKKEEDS